MKRVLILANHAIVIYNFRLELVQRLVKEGYEVHLSAPYDELIEELIKEKCVYHEIELDRRKTNPLKDYKLIVAYKKLISEIKPDMVFSYTIKPNIYGGLAAIKEKVPFVPNVTGLGSAVENRGWLSRFIVILYKLAFSRVQTVFFQNETNREFFVENKIALGKHKLLPGSGVNLERFTQLEYPKEDVIKFVFISRIMKEKGIDEYLDAAQQMKKQYSNVEFHICGFCEEAYEDTLKKLQNEDIIKYHGMVREVRPILSQMSCVVLPSYHEGMSNVLLEAAATGRPLLASDVPGCRETFEDQVGGYLFQVANSKDLFDKMKKFVMLTDEEREKMGLSARTYVVEHFDRRKVVDAYMKELK